jgi:hypothetical protein
MVMKTDFKLAANFTIGRGYVSSRHLLSLGRVY